MKKKDYEIPELTLFRVEVQKVIAASGLLGEGIEHREEGEHDDDWE